MDWSRNLSPSTYDPSKIRAEGFGSTSQRFSQGLPSGFSNSNPRPVFFVANGVRQLLNYSFQTGEEFVLEFMKYKADSGKAPAPNGNQRGAPGISILGLRSQSEIPILTSEEEARNKETQKSSNSDLLPNRMKFLCSFGGRFLPRPSDGKVRYVGGETHIIQLNKIISWQELVQKSKKFYNQVNTIKYQLPHEDLNVLISVSCNEDLHHMIEECSVLQNCEQKPRMFLFSPDDDDVHFSLKSTDADLERQYLVAVNGMEGSGEGSSYRGFLSASGSDLDQLIFEIDSAKCKDAINSASTSTVPSASGMMIPSKKASTKIHENISTSFGTRLNNLDHVELHQEGDKCSNSVIHHQDNLYNKVRTFQPPLSVPSEFKYPTKQESGSRTVSKPVHELPVIPKGVAEGMQGVSGTQDQEVSKGEIKPIDNFATQQESKPEKIQFSDHKLFRPAMQPKHSVSYCLQAEVTVATTSAPHFLTSSNYYMKYQEPEQISSPVDVHTSKNSESNEHSKFEVNLTGTSGVFHTEPLIHLSKSDGSIGSQQFIPNNNHLLAQQAVDKPVDPLPCIEKSDPDNSILFACGDRNNTKSIGWIWDDPEWSKLLGSSTSASASETDMGDQTTGDEISIKSSHSKEPMEAPPTQICADSYMEVVSQDIPSAFTMERNDTLGDTNNKYFSDVSELSSKARRSNEFSTRKMLHRDDVSVSLNFKNHDNRSFNGMRVMNDDHIDNPSLSNKVDERVSTSCLSTSSGNQVADQFVACSEQMREEYSTTLKRDIDMAQESYNISKVSWPHWLDGSSSGLLIGNQSQEVTVDAIEHVLELEDNEPGSDDEMGPEAIDALERDLDLSNVQIIKNEDLEDLRELGSGAFGTVYHGKWRGSDVAIKRIKDICLSYQLSQTDKMTSEFLREAGILSRLHHPNVVAFYGVVKDGPGGKLATVTEFMVSGSLKKVLLRKDRFLDRRKRLMLAMDAAIGMEYLHSRDVIHFDLKCDNLLVNLKDQSRPICKVADFGLSRMKLTTMVSGGMKGTLPWMAPELLTINRSKVSEKVDVYSFGIVMWEILTGDEPYADMHTGAVIGGILNNTLRPPVPTSCDVEWWKLMENCWSADPDKRPSFTQIVIHLRSMLEVLN